jgi:hypothetical protein
MKNAGKTKEFEILDPTTMESGIPMSRVAA